MSAVVGLNPTGANSRGTALDPATKTRKPIGAGSSSSTAVVGTPAMVAGLREAFSLRDDPELLDLTADTSRSSRPQLVVANSGDHPSSHHFLLSVFQDPSYDEFISLLDDPYYEPSDRLLVKYKDRILSHLLMSQRTMHFLSEGVPVSILNWLGTLPEFRGLGYAKRLMHVADQLMREDGSMLGMLRTRIPYFFRPHGWAVCGRHCHSVASSRDLLSVLRGRLDKRRSPRLNIRPWRQVELPALMRLYRLNTTNTIGTFERTEAYWRWLISRKTFDQIYVAIQGPAKMELDDTNSSIVGYAVTRDDEVIEMMTSPRHPSAAYQLLSRACSEAIERDYHHVIVHAPRNAPLHEPFLAAGGQCYDQLAQAGEVFMVKVLDPGAMLRMLAGRLHRRAEEAGLSRPCELGLSVEGARYRIVLTRRSVKVEEDRLGRSYLQCNDAELTRLLLGHLDLSVAVAEERMQASTAVAMEIGAILFPPLPIWRPPLDRLSY
jgi:GNAT superfamily N-acetyltransferase